MFFWELNSDYDLVGTATTRKRNTLHSRFRCSHWGSSYWSYNIRRTTFFDSRRNRGRRSRNSSKGFFRITTILQNFFNGKYIFTQNSHSLLIGLTWKHFSLNNSYFRCFKFRHNPIYIIITKHNVNSSSFVSKLNKSKRISCSLAFCWPDALNHPSDANIDFLHRIINLFYLCISSISHKFIQCLHFSVRQTASQKTSLPK